MKLKHFAKTDIGLKRKANEDSIGELLLNKSKYGNIYIVCDGMGGHEGGKMASETAINSIIEYFSNTPSDSPTTALKEAIEFANIQIFGKAQSDAEFKGMGTTCCVLLEKNNLIYIAHVGDSRIYISSDGKFHRITKDHSFVQGLFDNGQISEEEMETHARKNELTQALGVSTEVNVEVCSDPILAKKGDNFLICSDGLCGLIDDNSIYEIINKGKTNSDIGNNLIDAANNAGGTDNISVIYITIDESPHATSQFISKNNIPKDNLTKTLLMDTDQKAGILGKNHFSFFNKYKKIIFISSGALLISLLIFFIFSKIGNVDNINNEMKNEIEIINEPPVLDLDKNEYETKILIEGDSVKIFYYSFKKDENWNPKKKFTPLVDKVEKNYIMNSKVQEFYWNNEFIDYEEYKTNESILYSEDILENTFIFIRVDNLKKKVKSVSDPLGIEKAKAKKLAEEKKKKAEKEKKQKAANRAAKIKKNSNEEILKLNNANEKLNSLSKEISDIKSKINKLNLNNEKIVKFFDDANTNYNDQKSKFFDLYKGYNKIPDLLPTTDIPKGILELNNELFKKNNELNTIKTKASNDYEKAEKIQKDAATYLNNSKVKFKLAEDLRNEFKVIYNKDNKELIDRCNDDLVKINRAKDNVDVIEKKSDAINNEFKSIKEYLKKINKLSEKSKELSELIKKNVELKREKKRR